MLGGGKVRPDELTESLKHCPFLVAADGGATFAVSMGHIPEAVVGDMDSLPDEVAAAIPADRIHAIAEQDSTDFDKALRSISAPLVLGVGFLGGRVDHQLANLNVLVRRAETACILLGRRDVIFAAPRRLRLDLQGGSRVSLFPMSPVQGRSKGLQWPIDGLEMAPGARIGTSNRVCEGHSGPVDMKFDGPGMLVILPRAALRQAISALVPLSGDVHG